MSKNELYAKYNYSISHANKALLGTIGDGKVTDADLRAVVLDLAKKEQDEALSSLGAQYDADYEAARQLPDQAVIRLGEIAQMIAEYESSDEDRKRQLGVIAYYYAQAKNIPVENHAEAIEGLRREQADLRTRLEIDYDEHDYLLMPWVLPVDEDYINGLTNKKSFPEVLDWSLLGDQSEYEDVYPDPRPVEEDGGLAAKLHEWRGRLRDAGRLTVYTMATTEYGRTWTYQMIGDAIYDHSERDGDRREANARSLINNYVHGNGSTIPEGLRELERELSLGEGSVAIQIGRRWLLKDGKRHGMGQRIARLLIPGHELPEPDHSGDYEYKWCDDTTEGAVLSESQNMLAGAAIELVQGPSLKESALHPLVTSAAAESQDTVKNTATDGRVIEPDATISSASAEEVKQGSWQESFRVSAEQEVDRLIQRGLFNGDANMIPVNAVRGLGSKVLGTKTGDYRSKRAGIINGDEAAYTLDQVVAMSMLNGHGAALGNKYRRSEALRIIAGIIASRREEQTK